MWCLAGAGREEDTRACRVHHWLQGVTPGHFGTKEDPVARAFQRQSRCESGHIVVGGRNQHDVELQFVARCVIGEITMLVEHRARNRVRPPDHLEPFVIEAKVGRVVDARLPVAQAERGVLARQVGGVPMVGADLEPP